MAGNAVLSTRDLLTQTPAAWLQRNLKPNWSTERQTPFLYAVPGHNPLKDALVIGCGLLEHHDVITCSSLPEASLLSIFSGISGGTRGFHLTGDIVAGPGMWARWLCYVWGVHLLPGDPETQCVLRLAATAQHSHAGFSMPGGAYSSIDDFLEPQNWWVSLIKVCCSWASILLSYPTAMVGKAGFVPPCLCWHCLLLAICVVSLSLLSSSLKMTCPVPRYISTSC